MHASKNVTKSNLSKVDRHRITKVEYDEAPELTDEELSRVTLRHGNKVIRRGRPRSEIPKEPVTMLMDKELLAAYRATGPGWQGRINDDLRKLHKRKRA